MTNLEGEQHSFWRTTSPKMSYPKLENDIEVDVAVIGGGISGVLAAYCLTNAGKQVALIEAREFGGGSTGGTTAKLSSQHHLIYNEMIERDGEQIAKKFYEANENGRQLIESIVKQHNIDCDFSTVDSYVYAKEGSNTNSLQQEAKAYKTLGIDGELTESTPLNLPIESALVMRNQAEFHPMKFLHGVLQELDNMGAKLYQHTRYMDKEVHDDHLTLQTDSGSTVTCQQVVYATLFPVEDPQSFFSDTLQPMSSHLTAFAEKKPMADGMFISTEEPIRTFRKTRSNNKEVIIVGGDTHPTGDETPTTERYEAIQQFAAEAFETTDMLAYWSEHDQMTPDRRPFIGPLEEGENRMFVMTGYNKWGLAISGTAAQLITDLISKKDNEFQELLSPQRELPSDDEDDEESSDDEKDEQNDENEPLVSHIADQLKEGEAKSFMQNGEPTGMYKDKNGDIHCMNLSCTHLGCEVSWNNGDETWDCPCHGSVFDGTGKVIAGPAKEPLEQVNPF